MEKKRTRTGSLVFGLLSAAVLVILDQVTKYLAVANLKNQNPINIIKGVFQLSYLENRGAAFGILQGKVWVIVIFVTVILAGIGWLYLKTPMENRYRPIRIIMVMMAAGAVGNLIDRVIHNYVIDFLYFELIDFPVFNVADCYVTVAAALLIILVLFYYKEEDFHYIKWLR